MTTRIDTTGAIIIALERGDDIRACVDRVAADHDIVGAQISAIGAIEDPELGYYDLAARIYRRKAFPGIWELVSCQGNIAMKDGAPFLHAHVCIGGPDFAVKGGHLFDAKVGVVVEMIVRPFAERLERRPVEEVGLPCWFLGTDVS